MGLAGRLANPNDSLSTTMKPQQTTVTSTETPTFEPSKSPLSLLSSFFPNEPKQIKKKPQAASLLQLLLYSTTTKTFNFKQNPPHLSMHQTSLSQTQHQTQPNPHPHPPTLSPTRLICVVFLRACRSFARSNCSRKRSSKDFTSPGVVKSTSPRGFREEPKKRAG